VGSHRGHRGAERLPPPRCPRLAREVPDGARHLSAGRACEGLRGRAGHRDVRRRAAGRCDAVRDARRNEGGPRAR
jgi:hypothetical protein